MPNQPPLNPDALNELGIERAQDAYGDAILNQWWPRKTVIRIIRAYLSAAQPEVQANSKPNQNLELIEQVQEAIDQPL